MAHASAPDWASDTPVSMPVANDEPILVDFGGFGMTRYGIAHNLSKAAREEYIHPLYAPAPSAGGERA